MPTLGILSTHEIRRVELLIHFIHTHYRETISKGDIAIKLNDDPAQLQTLMKVHCSGLTIHKYHEQYRLQQALQDLQDVDGVLTISAIAEKHGYGSADYLRKVLKMNTGKTPKEIRVAAMQQDSVKNGQLFRQ